MEFVGGGGRTVMTFHNNVFKESLKEKACPEHSTQRNRGLFCHSMYDKTDLCTIQG